MRRTTQSFSSNRKIVANKLDPGVFVVEVPETGRKISFGQPPDVIKRLQQVGYFGSNAVNAFVLVDSKLQGESICWVLVEFPILYALYLCMVEVNGNFMPAFFAGKYPTVVGQQTDVEKALKMIKYANYGLDQLEELDAMDIPAKTREALKKEILGLAVGNEIKDSESFINSVYLDESPKSEKEFSDIGDGIQIGRTGYNRYKVIYQDDDLDIDVNLLDNESFRAPVEYKHFKFPVTNLGVWHTGEYDGMDPYYSCAHTSIIHKYEPILIDYPSNMTDIINHNGLSKESVKSVIVTHNHDDHIGAMVELFRRMQPCHIITTEPVKHSLIMKLSTLVDLPEKTIEQSFLWTVLPFRSDNPYQTETINLDGLKVTGHLSCHSVPTTVYTIEVNLDGHEYSYGHFLDIVAFKRMEMLVKDNWMPQDHLDHLHHIVREKKYRLIKYDAGCATDAAVPFSVHGQWQDLKNAATERSFRLFTHVTRHQLSEEYEKEGRFVRMGDLDNSIRLQNGRIIQLGTGNYATIAFFYQSYQHVLRYFESLLGVQVTPDLQQTMEYYAYAFASTPKHTDPNIGSFLIEQEAESDYVYIIVRGRAEIQSFDDAGSLASRSTVCDGEVMGDIGVLAHQPRMSNVKTLNRLTYLAVPASLFMEAMTAMNITYEGYFKEMFERRQLLQSASSIAQDVSTTVLNRIARKSETRQVKKDEVLFKKGETDDRLIIVPKDVILQAGGNHSTVAGPNVIGEYELFPDNQKQKTKRHHSAKALQDMEILLFDPDLVRDVPLITDNIRRLIHIRSADIYK